MQLVLLVSYVWYTLQVFTGFDISKSDLQHVWQAQV
jgi:hypothetical protein